MRTTIRSCTRCGGTHEGLPLRRLEPPLIIKFFIFRKYYNYWGLCPVTNNLILVTVTDEKGKLVNEAN